MGGFYNDILLYKYTGKGGRIIYLLKLVTDNDINKGEHNEEYIWLPNSRDPIHNKIGFVLFDFLNFNLANQDKIEKFLALWKIEKIKFHNGREIIISNGLLSPKQIDLLQNEQRKMKRYISIMLVTIPKRKEKEPLFSKNSMVEPEVNIDLAGIHPGGRLNIFSTANIKVTVDISLYPEYVMSKRTLERDKKTKRKLEEEIEGLEREIEKLENGRLDNFYNKDEEKRIDKEKDFCKEIDRLDNLLSNKRDKLNEVIGKGHEPRTKYYVADFITLCWLELILFVQNKIEARYCSLCGKIFILYGKKSITRCPICIEPRKASEVLREQKKIIEKIDSAQLTIKEVAQGKSCLSNFSHTIPYSIVESWL